MATPTFFNAAFYLETYPDLAANGITLETAFDHFQQFGETELRVPSAEYVGKVNTSSVFDYVMANADLRAAFGVAEGATALTKEQQDNGIVHYWTFGVNEDRPDALIDYVPGETPVETDLGKALEAIVAAEDNFKEVKLEIGSELNISPVTEGTIRAAIQDKLDAVDTAGGTGFTVDPTATPTAKNAVIDAKQIELDANVNLAKAQVSSVPGLQSKANALANAQTAYETAVKDAAGNFEAFELAVDSTQLLNASAAKSTVVTASTPATLEVAVNKAAVGTAGDIYLKADANGKVQAYAAVGASSAPTDPLASTTQKAAIKGLDALIVATQGIYDNAVAFAAKGSIATKELALKQAMVDVLNAEKAAGTATFAAGEGYPLVIDATTGLVHATVLATKVQGALANGGVFGTSDGLFNATNLVIANVLGTAAGGVDAGTIVNATGAQIATSSAFDAKVLDTLAPVLKSSEYTKAVKAAADFKVAADAYKDVANYETDFARAEREVDLAKADLIAQAKEEGVTLLIAGEDSATDGNDLFVFGSAPAKIYDFGKEGDDMFFFGTQYSFVKLEAGDDLAKDAFGSATALEVFAQQVGTDVVLSIELEAVSGSSIKGFTGDSITLAGVNLEDLSFADGFLTA